MNQLEVPERMGIYLFLLPNLKVGYIGSSNNLKRRYEEHISGKGNKTIKRHLEHNSNIEYMILEFCNGYKNKDLKIVEEYWINHFIKKGLKLINVSKPTEEIGYYDSKPVVAYNKDTLEFVGEWSSQGEASKAIKAHQANISACILKKKNLRTTKNCFWFFKDEFTHEKLIKEKQEYISYLNKRTLQVSEIQHLSVKARVRKIKQFSLEGILIKEWKSATEAGKSLGICFKNISSCATGRGKNKTAGGFIWKYAEESESNNESLCVQNLQLG